MALVVKNLPANAGDRGDPDSIPESGRFPGGENGNPLQFLAWRIPWIEDPGGLQWEESGVVKSQADRATEHPRECIQCAGYIHVRGTQPFIINVHISL